MRYLYIYEPSAPFEIFLNVEACPTCFTLIVVVYLFVEQEFICDKNIYSRCYHMF